MIKEILEYFLLIIAIMLLLKELYCLVLTIRMWWEIRKIKKGIK